MRTFALHSINDLFCCHTCSIVCGCRPAAAPVCLGMLVYSRAVITALQSGAGDIVHILRLVQACSWSRRSVSLPNPTLTLRAINMQQHKDQKRRERRETSGLDGNPPLPQSNCFLWKWTSCNSTPAAEIIHHVCLYLSQLQSCLVVTERRTSLTKTEEMLTDRLTQVSTR